MPKTTVIPKTSLADFISANIEPLLEAWEEFAQDLVSAHPAARDHARSMLMAIVADIKRAQTPAQQAEKSTGHGATHMASGLSMTEEVSEFRALRASVLRLWNAANPAPTPAANDEFMRLHEAIDQIMAESVQRYSADQEQQSESKREKLISDTIIESTPGAFFLIDQQANLVRWNTDLKNHTGLTDDQLRGSPILATLHEDDRALAAAKLMTAFATGYAYIDVRVLTRARGIRYYLLSVRRLLIESVPGAFYVIDAAGNYFRWNNYLSQLTGLSNRELRQRPLLLSIQEEDRPLAVATMKMAFENSYAQAELHVITREKSIRPFYMTARRFQVGVGTDTSEWRDRIKHLEHEAWTDPLTQVATRGHFMELAKLEFARSRRYGHQLSLWMLDIDHFKAVNDTYGHLTGDLALQSLVATSQQALRNWDILGRVGGEEFAVLLPETETNQALVVAERLRQTVATARVPLDEGKSVSLTVSIGIATAQENDTDIQALFHRADQALYEAKRTGRNKVCLAESTHS